MATKVNFIWSWIYQSQIHSTTVNEEYDNANYEIYVESFIKEVKENWRQLEKNIFHSIEEISGLKWKKLEINCYVIKISSLNPISDPLTIPIQIQTEEGNFTLSIERFIDMLVHELIHNLFIQNEDKMSQYFEYALKKYKNEQLDTVIHLLLHAIQKKIFLKIFDKKRLTNEKQACSFYISHKRSWELVEGIGEDIILQEFVKAVGLPMENA